MRILADGFSRGHVFLLEGNPGTGKTTMALRFLLQGAEQGEKCLYITLSETERELRAGAASHGWPLNENIEVFELVPPESLLTPDQEQTLLYSSDLELGETTQLIFDVFERVKPVRVVLDSLSEIRLLAQSSLRYRRQILTFKHYFSRQGVTVLLLDDLTSELSERPCTALCTVLSNSRNWPPTTALNVEGCAYPSTAARHSAAATMTSLFELGKWRYSRALSPPSIAPDLQGIRSRVASRARHAPRWRHRERIEHPCPWTSGKRKEYSDSALRAGCDRPR